jgi:2-oxoglutarate ferredoxin oxidoreductase subunit delta
MAKTRGYVIIDTESCKGCDLCVYACPTDVLLLSKEVNGKGYKFSEMANPEQCTGCTSCALVCPDTVITVYRAKI